jgi:hypothetical protein
VHVKSAATVYPEQDVFRDTGNDISARSFPMPKAYAVVTYRSVSDPEKLAA